MKRWMGTLLALVVVIAIGPSGWAANEPYVFEEWDMEVTVPEGGYYILTQDMDAESPALADMGLTAEQVNEILEQTAICLKIICRDLTYELNVFAEEGHEAIFDYALINEQQRDAMAAESKKIIESSGYTLIGGEVSWYEGEEAVFAIAELVPADSKDWSYQYQTVYNGRMVTVGASSLYLEEPTDEIKEQTRLLAEGIHFTRKLPVPEEVQKAYEEDENGPSMLMDILKNALIGAVAGGGGYIVFGLLRKKKGKKTASESEKLTGEDEL